MLQHGVLGVGMPVQGDFKPGLLQREPDTTRVSALLGRIEAEPVPRLRRLVTPGSFLNC